MTQIPVNEPLYDLIPLLLAVLIGGMVGFERESHGRPAGLRTHILVCLVSTLLILASRRVPALFQDGDTARIVFDPNRLGAGILTGIGFLGAATVVRSGDIVRGITTGATVWSVAGIGVVLGQGEYALALTGTGILFLVLVGLDRVSSSIRPVIYRRLVVRGRDVSMVEVANAVRAHLAEESIRVMDLSARKSQEFFELIIYVRTRDRLAAPDLIQSITTVEGISSVEWTS